jgi:hypothetical protein
MISSGVVVEGGHAYPAMSGNLLEPMPLKRAGVGTPGVESRSSADRVGEVTMTDGKGPKGLGGWLIVVGIGVVSTPIRMLVSALPVYWSIFTDGTWQAITSKSSEFYNPYFARLVVGEVIVNLILFGLSICLIYLFFKKHHRFPRLYIYMLIGSLLFVFLDAWLVSKVFPGIPFFDAEMALPLWGALFGALIWVPYMLVSERVRLTFVEG